MRRFAFFRDRSSISTILLLATGLHFASALGTFVAWRATGDNQWIDFFFHYQGSLFLIGFGAVEVMLSVIAWRQFEAREPLRKAWLFIVLSAVSRLVGGIFAHLLGVDSYLNPRYYLITSWGVEAIPVFRQYGLALGGTPAMALLAVGLFFVIHLYRKLGLLVRLKKIDYLLLGMVLLYTAHVLSEVAKTRLESTAVPTLFEFINWCNDPLLSLLLLEAIVIRRAVVNMGWGLIAKCWGAFTAAIFITSLGSMGLWAVSHSFLSTSISIATWYVWFMASAAYALGPAFQVEASLRARMRVENIPEGKFWERTELVS